MMRFYTKTGIGYQFSAPAAKLSAFARHHNWWHAGKMKERMLFPVGGCASTE